MKNYIGDFEKCKDRMMAFWNFDYIGRCALGIDFGARKRVVNKSGNEKFWNDPDEIVSECMDHIGNYRFFAEGVPHFHINLGPHHAASFFGGKPIYHEYTVWYDKVIKNLYNFRIAFDETSNIYWNKTINLLKTVVEAVKGDCYVDYTDIGEPSSILSLLRGTEELCIDLYEEPDAVKRLFEEVNCVVLDLYKKQYDVINKYLDGCTSGLGLWSPELHLVSEADFASVISPRQAEEFLLPGIQEWCRQAKYNVYHLDGPPCVKMLDYILEIPELNAIQWPWEIGSEWIGMLKRIQSRSKGLCLYAGKNELDEILSNLSPKGLFVCISDCENEEQAREIEKIALNTTAKTSYFNRHLCALQK